MPSSLTSFIPYLPPFVGVSEIAIYERQRALVRLGLLPKPIGRGRGSGAEATAHNVALLLISLLATDSLSEMDERIARFVKLPIRTWRKRKKCVLTGAHTFGAALAHVLENPEVAARIQSASLSRQEFEARLHWNHKNRVEVSIFGGAAGDYASVFGPAAVFVVSAQMRNPMFRQLAALLSTERTIA